MNIKKTQKKLNFVYDDEFAIAVGVPRCRPTLIAVIAISFDALTCCCC